MQGCSKQRYKHDKYMVLKIWHICAMFESSIYFNFLRLTSRTESFSKRTSCWGHTPIATVKGEGEGEEGQHQQKQV